MKISVLGCGRWGSCIAWYLDRIGHEVVSCGLQNAPELQQLLKTHHNDYLTYPESITVTYDHQFAIERAEVIVISISAQYLRDYMQTITEYDLDGKIIVLCMKGIEESTGKRLTQVVSDFVDTDKTPVAVWVGPGHPQDYVKGIPNCMVIDSENEEVKDKLVHSFNSELIRFYLGTDLIGSEIGAAAKNVVGIAGCTSIKGALMARGTREVARLIKAAGGNELSAYGLCHLGDYEATLFSPWSHNRRFGEMYIKGEKFEKLAEGVMTSKAMVRLGEQLGVDLPITTAVYRILFESIKEEF